MNMKLISEREENNMLDITTGNTARPDRNLNN